MKTRPMDAKKHVLEIINIMELKHGQVQVDEMDRRLHMVKWILAISIPLAVLILAY